MSYHLFCIKMLARLHVSPKVLHTLPTTQWIFTLLLLHMRENCGHNGNFSLNSSFSTIILLSIITSERMKHTSGHMTCRFLSFSPTFFPQRVFSKISSYRQTPHSMKMTMRGVMGVNYAYNKNPTTNINTNFSNNYTSYMF